MKDEIWHISHGFEKSKPRDVLGSVLNDDWANYKKAESDLQKELDLLNRAMALYIELVQQAYLQMDKWKTFPSVRAALAMAVSTLNYAFLIRHGILLGYPEALDLIRSCHERMTRCYLFFVDEGEAKRFLAGGEIKQTQVDKKLAKLVEKEEKTDGIFQEFRKYYGNLSERIHPNLTSLGPRMPSKDLQADVGLAPLLGGMMSQDIGRTYIVSIIQCMNSSAHVLRGIVPEGTGTWEREFEQVKAETEKIVSSLNKTTS